MRVIVSNAGDAARRGPAAAGCGRPAAGRPGAPSMSVAALAARRSTSRTWNPQGRRTGGAAGSLRVEAILERSREAGSGAPAHLRHRHGVGTAPLTRGLQLLSAGGTGNDGSVPGADGGRIDWEGRVGLVAVELDRRVRPG